MCKLIAACEANMSSAVVKGIATAVCVGQDTLLSKTGVYAGAVTCRVVGDTAVAWPESGRCRMAGLSEKEGWSPQARFRSEGMAEKGRARPSSPA